MSAALFQRCLRRAVAGTEFGRVITERAYIATALAQPYLAGPVNSFYR